MTETGGAEWNVFIILVDEMVGIACGMIGMQSIRFDRMIMLCTAFPMLVPLLLLSCAAIFFPFRVLCSRFGLRNPCRVFVGRVL